MQHSASSAKEEPAGHCQPTQLFKQKNKSEFWFVVLKNQREFGINLNDFKAPIFWAFQVEVQFTRVKIRKKLVT